MRLWYDADQVDALSADREALWSRVAAADFLTVNEKRAAVGYGEVGRWRVSLRSTHLTGIGDDAKYF